MQYFASVDVTGCDMDVNEHERKSYFRLNAMIKLKGKKTYTTIHLLTSQTHL